MGHLVNHFVDHYGLGFLFAIVSLESAGVWLPGETALIAAGVVASQGHLSIVAVIAVAAAGAILGDNVGYWIGRRYGRRLLERFGWLDRLLPRAERFFRRHGGKAVFLARFVAGVGVGQSQVAQSSALAVAVSNAGGLGSLPCALLGLDAMRHHAEHPAAAVVFEAGEPFEQAAVAERVVVAADRVPAGGHRPLARNVDLSQLIAENWRRLSPFRPLKARCLAGGQSIFRHPAARS